MQIANTDYKRYVCTYSNWIKDERCRSEVHTDGLEILICIWHIQSKIGRDLTQSYDKNPYTHRLFQKA